MLALSPLLPTFEFPLEDQLISYEPSWESIDPLLNFNHEDWNTLDSIVTSSTILENKLPNSQNSGASSRDPSATKKLNHNASERDRRQKLNGVYSTLRSLLPGTDQKKKLSIPNTISQALKYIPQLQNQIEKLVQRKEDILSNISKQRKESSSDRKRDASTQEQSLPTVSMNQINVREIVIQICTSRMKNSFLRVLENLEGEHELEILNASTFESGENKVFYTVHVQVKENQGIDGEMLSEKISSLC